MEKVNEVNEVNGEFGESDGKRIPEKGFFIKNILYNKCTRVATTISFQMKCIDRVGKACDSPRSPFTSFTFSPPFICMWFKNGLKAQKLLAQGIALGIMTAYKSPCKGKSLINCLVFESFCPLPFLSAGDRYFSVFL